MVVWQVYESSAANQVVIGCEHNTVSVRIKSSLNIPELVLSKTLIPLEIVAALPQREPKFGLFGLGQGQRYHETQESVCG